MLSSLNAQNHKFMLTELEIRNFKLFEHLKIEGLRRVNLFAGKNNSGKTALLEALRIMAAGKDISVMHYILNQRGQRMINHWTAYDPFFYGPALKSTLDNNPLELQIGSFRITRIAKGDKNTDYFIKSLEDNQEDLNQLWSRNSLPHPIIPQDTAVFIPFGAMDYFPLQKLWDSIVLTPEEDKVTEIIKETILPNLIRLDINAERTLVRLKGEKKPLPLKVLGDGAQRILLIAVGLVSAQNNILLLDEIEVGLHYSVLEKLWEIIFRYAEELNVQVFATTHSSDAIQSFVYTSEKMNKRDQAAYFRLQNNRQNGQPEVISYDLARMENALESNLEIR